MLKGQIDLVFKNSRSQWVILDYKTNQIEAHERAQTAKKYALQLALYALVFKQIVGQAPQKGVLYFSKLDATDETVYCPDDFERIENEMNVILKRLIF